MDESQPGAKRIALGAEWFIRAISNNETSHGRKLGISGATGCGKTHAARAIDRFIDAFGIDIMFEHRRNHWETEWVDFPSLSELDDEKEFREKLADISRSAFVVIDDIGSESDRFKNGVSASRLRRLLQATESAWVVATSNMSMESIIEMYDARNADRLRQFHWVQVGDVPSYRPKLKKGRSQ